MILLLQKREWAVGTFKASPWYEQSCLIFLLPCHFAIKVFLEVTCVSGDGYYYYGFEVANQILEGKDWTRDGRFARVTLCDFKIRTVG